MTPKISIIVPVYNVEPYLEKCVKSILAQTFEDFELILVDDGSTDGSAKLCDKLSKTDARIIYQHETNGGLSSARNAGLDVCKGEYITFVDSDDMIAPNALELLYHSAVSSDSDSVVSVHFTIFSDGSVKPQPAIVKNSHTLDGISAVQEIMCHNTRWEACGHLFKSSLWSSIRFPQGKLYEDFATTPYIFAISQKVAMLDTSLYYYFQRQDSIMRQSERKTSLDLCTISIQLLAYFKNIKAAKSLRSNICSGVLMELCSRTDLAEKNISINSEFVKIARKILRRNVVYILRSDFYTIKQKVYYLMETLGLHNMIQLIHKTSK